MTTSRGIALVADDHELFRIALSAILTSRLEYSKVLQAESVEAALETLGRHPDIGLVSLDLCMPGFEDPGVFGVVSEAYPNPFLVAMSGSATHGEAVACVRAGARAFIPKALSAEEIAAALARVLAGESFVPEPDATRPTMYLEDGGARHRSSSTKSRHLEHLTARQKEVHGLLVQGLSNKEIARRLDLSTNTVKVHAFAICRLLGVHDRRDLVRPPA